MSPAFTEPEVAELAHQLGVGGEVDLDQLRMGMAVELEHGLHDPLTGDR
jgi:hypothetical protein